MMPIHMLRRPGACALAMALLIACGDDAAATGTADGNSPALGSSSPDDPKVETGAGGSDAPPPSDTASGGGGSEDDPAPEGAPPVEQDAGSGSDGDEMPGALSCADLQGSVDQLLADVAVCSSDAECEMAFLGSGCSDSALPLCGFPTTTGSDLTRIRELDEEFSDRCVQEPILCAGCLQPTSVDCVNGACEAQY